MLHFLPLNSARLILDLLLLIVVEIGGRILRGGREGRYKNPTPQKFVHHYKVSGKPTDCRVADLLEA